MNDDADGPKIYVDSDWKADAQREKEKLVAEEAKAAQAADSGQQDKPSILSIVNLLATQALVALGGMKTPDGQAVPPDPNLARVFIDMVGVLEEKTTGNLADDEKKVLAATLHELRAQYVQLAGVGAAPPAQETE